MAFKKKHFAKKVQKVVVVKKHRKKRAELQITLLRCPYRHGNQMYPDRYMCVGRASANIAVSLGSASNYSQFVVGVVANQICNGNGPSVGAISGAALPLTNTWNVTAYGAANLIPSGLSYLLGNLNQGTNQAGGNAPYFKYRVHSSTIKATFMPVVNGNAVEMTVFPYNDNALGSGAIGQWGKMLSNQLAEQPGAKTKYIPPTVTNPSQGTITNKCNILTVIGDKYKQSLEGNAGFSGTYANNPSALVHWAVSLAMNAFSGGGPVQGNLQIDVYYNIEFYDRQLEVTIPPT